MSGLLCAPPGHIPQSSPFSRNRYPAGRRRSCRDGCPILFIVECREGCGGLPAVLCWISRGSSCPNSRRTRAGRVKVLFVAESPLWATGRLEVAQPPDCLRPDYPCFRNACYDTRHRRGERGAPGRACREPSGCSGPMAGRAGRTDLFAESGFFLVDTVKCVFRKNRKPSVLNDLVRMSP